MKNLILINIIIFISICFVNILPNENIYKTNNLISTQDLKIKKAEIILNYNKNRYEKLLKIFGKENKETEKSKLDYELSKIDLDILKLSK